MSGACMPELMHTAHERCWCLLARVGSHSSKEIFKAVLRGNPSFSVPPWPSISDQAKSLVQWMLQPDPSKRPTAHDVLCT